MYIINVLFFTFIDYYSVIDIDRDREKGKKLLPYCVNIFPAPKPEIK